MPIEVNKAGDTVTIKVNGRFDFNLHQEFRQAYEDSGEANSKFVLDFAGTEYLDSSALGMLLVLREFAGASNADIAITNCSTEIRKLLEIANYERLFKIDDPVT